MECLRSYVTFESVCAVERVWRIRCCAIIRYNYSCPVQSPTPLQNAHAQVFVNKPPRHCVAVIIGLHHFSFLHGEQRIEEVCHNFTGSGVLREDHSSRVSLLSGQKDPFRYRSATARPPPCLYSVGVARILYSVAYMGVLSLLYTQVSDSCCVYR